MKTVKGRAQTVYKSAALWIDPRAVQRADEAHLAGERVF